MQLASMKIKMKGLALATAVLVLETALAQAQPAPPAPAVEIPAVPSPLGPKIKIATPLYDFGRARAGDPVKYTYYFTNSGDEMLILSNVQPQCGCTAAGDWTRQVEPGQSGGIPIQFNTVNYNGPVFKQVTVTCNDKTQRTLALHLKGTVFKPLDVNPQIAVLNIPPDAETGSAIVSITNHTDEPLTLAAPESNNRSYVAKLKTIEPGRSYQLEVSAVSPLPTGGTQGLISMKTSWTNPTVLNVTVYANVQPAISVIPSRIMLPPAPLSAPQTPSVTIQNNSTNALVLSEPSVNLPGVETQIKEMQAGRTFAALVTFPKDFEVTPGQQVELTIKSSNPKFPLVKIPVTQISRQAATPLPSRPLQPVAPGSLPTPVRSVRSGTVNPPPLPPALPSSQ
jgi:hypothetical protein